MSKMVPAWIRGMLGRLRSIGCTRRALRRLNHAQQLRQANRPAEALAAARAGLDVLREPAVRRREPPEATAVFTLTAEVERLARELDEPGAPLADLRESLTFLRGLDAPDAANSVRELRAEWIPYLEARVGGSGPGG